MTPKTEVTLQSWFDVESCTRRFQNLVRRLQDPNQKRKMPPYIGIPLAPGAGPFVVKRELLEGQIKGLVGVMVQATFLNPIAEVNDPEQWSGYREQNTWLEKRAKENLLVLCITGRSPSGKTKHRAYLYNVVWSQKPGDWRGKQFKIEIYKWAEGLRKAPDRVRTWLGVEHQGDPESKRKRKLEARKRNVQAEIEKLQKQLLDCRRHDSLARRLHLPHTPLLNKGGQYYNGIRENALEWHQQKPLRQALSRIGNQALAKSKLTPHPHKDWKLIRRMNWYGFNIALSEAGLSPRDSYNHLHGLTRGPESPEQYVRNLKYFSPLLYANYMKLNHYWGSHADLEPERRNTSKYLRDGLEKECREHYGDLQEYANAIREKQDIENRIATLTEIRESLTRELEGKAGLDGLEVPEC